MLTINKIMLTGRLTRDPEQKYLQSGTAVCTLGMVSNRKFKDKAGEWRDEAMFIDVEVWGKQAEWCAESMRKGQPVYVEGYLKQDSWEKDGQKRSVIKITADNVKSFQVPKAGDSEPRESSEPVTQEARPSDNLNFGGQTARKAPVQDDIPF